MAVAAVLLVAGCGGGDDADEGAGDDEVTTTTEDTAEDEGAEEEEEEADESATELPDFIDDFIRVCENQIGFGGAATYTAGPGPHLMAFFEEFDDSLIRSSRELPAGWMVEQDSDFEDNSEFAPVELVVCGVRTDERPNGTTCDFDDEGETVTLELVDTTYEYTAYEATTGEEVGSFTLEGNSTECPLFALLDEEDPTYRNDPVDEEVIGGLQPIVDP